MKPSARTFRIQWDVHAWLGVVLSFGLFIIFYFGTFTLFRAELSIWQTPQFDAPRSACSESWERRFEAVERHIEFPEGARFLLVPAPNACRVRGWVYDAARGSEEDVIVDMRTSERLSERSRLASELYDMHFFYRVPHGLELSGVLALGLFVSLVTGFVIHVKNLWRQRWQFRAKLRWRFAASDAHKVLGVFGAPLAVTFAWSGCILGLAPLLIPAMAGAVYDGNEAKASALYYGPELDREAVEPHATSAPRLPFDVLVEKAREASPGARAVDSVEGDELGTAAAYVRVVFARAGLDQDRSVVLDAATGRVLATQADESSASSRFNRVMFDLHFANYGGFALRAVYALLSFLVCVVIVTGNVIWLERRDATRARRGNRFLERATIGGVCGTNLATAVYFFANRVLPEGTADRAMLEFRIFLCAWVVSFLASLVPVGAARGLGSRMCAIAGGLWVLCVVGDLVRIDWPSISSGGEQVAIVASDALLLLAASMSWATSWFLQGTRSPSVLLVKQPSEVTSL